MQPITHAKRQFSETEAEKDYDSHNRRHFEYRSKDRYLFLIYRESEEGELSRKGW